MGVTFRWECQDIVLWQDGSGMYSRSQSCKRHWKGIFGKHSCRLGSSYDEYIKNFETIAKIVGKEDKAKTKIEETEKLLSDVKAKAQEKLGDKKILTVSPKNDEYTAHTSTSFVGQVLEKAGFVNAIENNDKEVSLSLEQLVEINPDIMVYMREDIDKTIYKITEIQIIIKQQVTAQPDSKTAQWWHKVGKT